MQTGRVWCGAFLFTAAAVCGAAAQLWTEDFENGTKSSYAAGDVTCTMGSWRMDDALIGNLTDDRFFDCKSVRIRNSGFIAMNFDKTDGAGEISVYFAKYGTNPNATGKIEYSTDSGVSWTQAGDTVAVNSTILTQVTRTLNIGGNVRFRISKTGGDRVNVDNIAITDYSGPSPLAAPMALEATAVNAECFTANWTEVAEAEGYLLDVWTFLGIPPTKAQEGFDNYPASTPDGWTITNEGTTIYTSAGNFGAMPPSVRLSATEHEIVTCVYPAAVTNFSFWYNGQSASNSFLDVYAYGSAGWTQLDQVQIVNSGTIMDYNFDINQQYVQFKLVYQKDAGNIAVDDISASYGNAAEHFILCDESVASTNYNLTGLTPGVYYYRVRAEDGDRVSADSNVIMVDTEAEPLPPVVEPVTPQSVRLGVTLEFAVTVTPTEGDAVTATNAVPETVVAGAWSFDQGVLSFTPVADDLGEQRFVFTAQDKDGWSEPMTVIVTVRQAQTQAVVMDAVSGDYTQDFDTLATSGTENEWDNLAWPLPAWSAFAGASAVTSYRASTGTSTVGALYSFGTDADRAIGSLASGGNQYVYGVAFTNATGQAVTNLNVSFTAEQWRVGANAAAHTLTFEYCVTNSLLSLTEGAWRRVKTLCFESPMVTNETQAAGACYAPARLSAAIPRPVAAGEVALLRWRDPFESYGHGFGVDDLAVTWAAGAMPDAIPVGLAGVSEDFDEMGGSAAEELPWMWRVESRDDAPRVSGPYAAAGNRTAQANSAQQFISAGSYNFAATQPGDQAVGGLSDGTTAKSVTVAAKFLNAAGMALKNWQVCYNIEKYRNGTVATAVRLLVSTDGETWQAAGAPAVFAADADTDGCAVDARPGATVAEERQVTFEVPVAKGGVFYMAWQIAVAEGEVTEGAQALGVDDITVMPRVPNGSVLRVE